MAARFVFHKFSSGMSRSTSLLGPHVSAPAARAGAPVTPTAPGPHSNVLHGAALRPGTVVPKNRGIHGYGTQIKAHSAFTFCISLPSCLPVTTTPLFFQLNAAVTVQTLIDVFSVSGIVHYGTAGSSNDSVSFGDVSVPKLVAHTGAWTWKKFKSPKKSSAELRFGEYNIPNAGENLLGSLKFRKEELYSVGKPMEEVFWLPVDSAWLKIAEKLKVKLERCNGTFCLPTTPKVLYGLKASSADIFLDNAEYRKFLFREFGVSTVDEESAAVVMTTTSPGVPVIVFRGVSDLAGGEPKQTSTTLYNLATVNSLKMAVEFIATVGKL
ncbi:Bark storage protein A [Dichanthelium oligosanthes]|uniref:Bark storage protein A n=1 Tax=Dichanthelium oligosanthes TaxID=888268 RepID=A0A1E5UPI0_9POAL|nr:Bark storage protein A [Dichanthelium oligosanthes]